MEPRKHNIVEEYILLKKWINVIFKFQGMLKKEIIEEKWQKLLQLYKTHRYFEVNEINGKTQLLFEVEDKKCQILVSFVQNERNETIFFIETDERSKRIVHAFKQKAIQFTEENKKRKNEHPSQTQEVEETHSQPTETNPPNNNLSQVENQKKTEDVVQENIIRDEIFEEIVQYAKQFQ